MAELNAAERILAGAPAGADVAVLRAWLTQGGSLELLGRALDQRRGLSASAPVAPLAAAACGAAGIGRAGAAVAGAPLTASELEACRLTGTDPAAFAAHRDKLNAERAARKAGR